MSWSRSHKIKSLSSNPMSACETALVKTGSTFGTACSPQHLGMTAITLEMSPIMSLLGMECSKNAAIGAMTELHVDTNVASVASRLLCGPARDIRLTCLISTGSR